jgi:hypothetical protein
MAAVTPVLCPALWTASEDGQTEEVFQLLAGESREVDIEERWGPHETSPLHEAALGVHEAIVLLLLEHGADVLATDNRGLTSIHFAACHNNQALLLLLLDRGADLKSTTYEGQTPLHAAANYGRMEMAQLLLDKGADLQSKTNDGQTAEDYARHHPLVAAMLKAEAERREAVLKAEAERLEAVRKAQCVAFAMGDHERLGAGSLVRWLDAGVVGMVLEQV